MEFGAGSCGSQLCSHEGVMGRTLTVLVMGWLWGSEGEPTHTWLIPRGETPASPPVLCLIISAPRQETTASHKPCAREGLG